MMPWMRILKNNDTDDILEYDLAQRPKEFTREDFY